jgi:CRISPR-associated protein Csm1
MSFQILLQGKITGIDMLLATPASEQDTAGGLTILGRARWASLLSEILPRALLAELGLAKILLGMAGGGQFLVVLPNENRSQANEFLEKAAAQVVTMSAGRLSLVWAFTESLGDWSDIRKRLNEEFDRKSAVPLAHASASVFDTYDAVDAPSLALFSNLAVSLPGAIAVSWSPEDPARISLEGGKHTWSIKDELAFPHHAAPGDSDYMPATTAHLSARATGRKTWGVLMASVDHYSSRIRRAQTDLEYLQLSILYQQFFRNEVEMLSLQPEYWQKVTILYCGASGFALYGSWDTLVAFASEAQRVFHSFAEANLKDLAGAEGKTITMSLALATGPDSPMGLVCEEAAEQLRLAKTADKDCIHFLGRTLEWKQLKDAAELKDQLAKMVIDFGVPSESIRDLQTIYRENGFGAVRAGKRQRVERPWRYHRRINRVLENRGRRDFQKLRAAIVADLIGKNPTNVKLRPSGRVALEWARLFTEETSSTSTE